MVKCIQTTLLFLAIATSVTSQFFDFYSALQPFAQYTTSRPLHEITTRKIKVHNSRHETPTFDNNRNRGNHNSDKESALNPAAIIFDETTKTNRKTTNNSNRRNISNSNTGNIIQSSRNNTNDNTNRSTKDPPKNQQTQRNKNDRIQYPDGRLNTVYSYETTRAYATKAPFVFEDTYRPNNMYATQNAYKPGVRPAVTQGTPITNRPVTQRPTQRPNLSESDDTSITPELIIGPDEDFMTSVEKRRYIELSERMCDKYKSLQVKQVEAIPLLPSPDSVKVNVSSCTPTNVPLVVGGKVVNIQEFPHMALLGWKKIQSNGYYWKCGGSLISNQYILTAAHCAYQDRDNNVVMGPPRAVQLGSSYLNGANAKVVKVAAVYRHPKYKQPKSYYDIAIVKLANPVTFSDKIKPACLGVPPPVDEPVIATGWGRTEFGGDQSNELRSVSIPVWDMNECYDVLGTSRKLPDGPSRDSQICAGEKKGGKDTCQGDSGGPAQIQDGCVWRVTAVTSLGRSCGAPHTPALYALVPRAFVASIAFDTTDNIQFEEKNTFKQNTQRSVNNNHRYDNSEVNNYSNNNNRDNLNNNNNYQSSSVYTDNNNNQRNDYQSTNIYNNNNSNRRSDNQYSNNYNNNHNTDYRPTNAYNDNNNQRNDYPSRNTNSNYNNPRNEYQSSSTHSNNNNGPRNDYQSSNTYNKNHRNDDYTTQKNYYSLENNYNPTSNNNFGVLQNGGQNPRLWWT